LATTPSRLPRTLEQKISDAGPFNRSIVSNRNQMRQAREALKAVPLEQREELRRNGIGPGDSYIGMWRMVNRYRYRLDILDQEMRADTTPKKRRELEKDIR
jgi:hypothetical protein